MPKGLIQEAQEEEVEAPAEPQDEAPMESEQPENENRLRIVMGAMKLMYSEQTSNGIVQMLRAKNQAPAAALATTTLFIIKTLNDESKGTLPPQEVGPAASQVVQLAAELARAAGVQLDDQGVAQADQAVQQSIAKRFPQQAAPVQAEPAPEAPVEEEVVEEEE